MMFPRRGLNRALLVAWLFLMMLPVKLAATPVIAVSVKPLHSLVSNLTQGITTPQLLLGSGSPHDASLKPSQARLLQEADVVVWMGPELEGFLAKPIAAIAGDAAVISLLSEHRDELDLLPFREPHEFALGKAAIGTDHHHDHDHHGLNDPHAWLDPLRAATLSEIVAEHLATIDTNNAGRYRANLAQLKQRLQKLNVQISAQLKPMQSTRLLVFHDAFQYFEQRFGLTVVGSVTVSPDVPNSVRHVRNIQQLIRAASVQCAFSEPQFDDRLMTRLLIDSDARLRTMDPLGSRLPAGPELYFDLLQAMADAVSNCRQK